MKYQVVAVMTTILLGMPAIGSAQAPGLMSFHGYLTDLAGNPVDEPEQGATFQVSMYYEADSTQAFWTDEFVDIPVAGGVFRLLLGAGNNPIPSSELDGGIKYVGISVNGGPEMEPKLQLVSVPYAFRADAAETAITAVTADALGGIPAANFVQTSSFNSVQEQVSAMQATIDTLEGKVDILQALVNGAGCANECNAGSKGCSDDLNQIWSCGEADDGDPCTEKLFETCTGVEKCDLGECTCAPDYTTVCSDNAAYFQDSCGQLGSLIGNCGEGLCNEGKCIDWELETPPPLSGMNDTFALGGELYSVGNNGQVVHYDGVTWTRMASGTTKNLHAIWGYESSGPRLYAVGEGGKVIFYNGSKWNTVVTGSFNDLNEIFGLSDTDIFAVGSSGTVLRFNGTVWQKEQWNQSDHPWLNTNFTAVWAHSGSQAWIGGNGGTVIQWDGTEWTEQITPSNTGDIRSLWGVSANNVWAATNGTIIRFTNAWSVEQVNPPGSVSFNAIWGEVDGTIKFFAGGQGGAVYSYDSVSWTKQDKVNEELTGAANIVGVFGGTDDAPFDSVWVVAGNGEVAYNDPTGKWVFPTIQTSINAFYTIDSGDDQWAVGSNCSAYRQTGGQWLPVDVNGCTGNFNAIWGDGTSENIIAVGDSGTYVTWDGTEWVDSDAETKPSNGTIYDIWGLDNSNLFAITDSGTHVWNGTSWQNTGGGNGVAGWGNSMTNYYVCGNGQVERFDGSEWTTTSVPANLMDIHGSGGSVWTVGNGGAAFELVGGVWQDRDLGTTAKLNSVFTTGSNVLVVGNGGFTASGTPGNWDTQTVFPAANLKSVTAAPNNKFLLGGNGVIFRR